MHERAPQFLLTHAERGGPLLGLAGDRDAGVAQEIEFLHDVAARSGEGRVFLLREDGEAAVQHGKCESAWKSLDLARCGVPLALVWCDVGEQNVRRRCFGFSVEDSANAVDLR